jgi:cardiolipin synthase
MSELFDTKPVFACEYYEHLLGDIQNSTQSVHLQAMDFSVEGQMEAVTQALSERLDRGICVSLAFDARSYGREGNIFRKTIANLKNRGATIYVLGKPFGSPIIGRCHSKFSIIDDISYFGGGINLSETSFDNFDYMLRSDYAPVARTLETIAQSTRRDADRTDREVILDKKSKLVIDSGSMGSSIILDTAKNMLDTAHKAWYVSQFAPDPLMSIKLRLLKANAVCIYNTPRSMSGVAKVASLIDKGLACTKNQYQGTKKIHAKFLITEDGEGNRTTLSGSHNFALSGVLFGTQELALLSTDRELADNLIIFAESLLPA